MKSYPVYSDNRLHRNCAYCNAVATTRDHVPAKVFLSKPYPSNLHVVPACEKCNNDFSKDEVYLAFLIDYFVALESSATEVSLEAVIERYKRFAKEDDIFKGLTIDEKGWVFFDINFSRLENVLRKFAICHMLYETGTNLDDAPLHLKYAFISQLTNQDLTLFNRLDEDSVLPEIGSRLFQRILSEGNSWITIQEGIYRYFINAGSNCYVKFVIKEFLFCEVSWDC